MPEPTRPQEEGLDLSDDATADDPANDESGGLSLDALTDAFAEMLGRGEDPYTRVKQKPGDAEPEETPSAEEVVAETQLDEVDDETCDISPRSILEAMLFVGHPDNEPLTSRQVAALMRGVRPQEVDDLVRELNADYAEAGCPYTIVSVGNGYNLGLTDEFSRLRAKFYGKVREARLSQAAIDVLAVVAYHPGRTVAQIDKLRGQPCKSLLSQLVRRELLRLQREEGQKMAEATYHTTDRFLDLFGLETLDDLPRGVDVEIDY
jgi:segregation and condensation protein B